MIHALLALFQRSIREHVRSGALIGARVALAITLLVCLYFYGHSGFSIGASGLAFFDAIIRVNAIYITLAGCSYFASAITEEKEDGTLGLLQMSGMSPTALLLGKGATRLLDGLLLLVVQVPFVLIGVTLGGIAWVQVLSAYAALAAFLFLICNVALLCSVIAERSAKAAVLACVASWLLLYGGGILGTLTGIFSQGIAGSWLVESLAALDVFGRLDAITATNFNGPIFSPQVAHSLLLGFSAFVAARLVFDRFADNGATEKAGGMLDRFTRPVGMRRAPVFGLMQWRDFHFLHGGDSITKWKYAAYGILALWLGMDLFTSRPTTLIIVEWGVRVVKFGILGLFVEACIGTSRMLGIELRDRTLPALYVLPLHTMATLLAEKQAAVRRTLRPAFHTICAGVAICVLVALGDKQMLGNTMIAMVMGPFVLFFAAPWVLAEFLLLQRLIIHCSLRFRTGAMPVAIGVWLLGNVIIGVLSAVFAGPAAPLLAIVPLAIWASKLRVRNLRLLDEIVAAG